MAKCSLEHVRKRSKPVDKPLRILVQALHDLSCSFASGRASPSPRRSPSPGTVFPATAAASAAAPSCACHASDVANGLSSSLESNGAPSPSRFRAGARSSATGLVVGGEGGAVRCESVALRIRYERTAAALGLQGRRRRAPASPGPGCWQRHALRARVDGRAGWRHGRVSNGLREAGRRFSAGSSDQRSMRPAGGGPWISPGRRGAGLRFVRDGEGLDVVGGESMVTWRPESTMSPQSSSFSVLFGVRGRSERILTWSSSGLLDGFNNNGGGYASSSISGSEIPASSGLRFRSGLPQPASPVSSFGVSQLPSVGHNRTPVKPHRLLLWHLLRVTIRPAPSRDSEAQPDSPPAAPLPQAPSNPTWEEISYASPRHPLPANAKSCGCHPAAMPT